MASDKFQSVTIEGFKSIRSIKDLPLRLINLLMGANGSGKSNFLEAFVFLSEAQAERRDLYVERHGGAERLLHHGSKNTQKIKVNLTASNSVSWGVFCEYCATRHDARV